MEILSEGFQTLSSPERKQHLTKVFQFLDQKTRAALLIEYLRPVVSEVLTKQGPMNDSDLPPKHQGPDEEKKGEPPHPHKEQSGCSCSCGCQPELTPAKSVKVNLDRGPKYSDAIKKEAVKHATDTNNNREAARRMKETYPDLCRNLDESLVRSWRKDERLNEAYEFDRANENRKRIRKIHSPYYKLEELLVQKIKEKRLNKQRVSRDWIVKEAKDIFGDEKFVGSSGWFSNFRKRWRISRRVATHIIQKLKDDYAVELKTYLEEVRRFRFDAEMREKKEVIVGNMDEVCMKFNMSDGSTYDFVGQKQVSLTSCGGSKATFTVMLAILSDGTKLPPLVVFKSKYPVPKTLQTKYSKQVIIHTNPKGWCNEQIMHEWLNKLWNNLDFTRAQQPLLIMDKFSVHSKPEVLEALKKSGSEVKFIPPGCTGLAQPLDTHVNRPFKAGVKKLFDAWYTSFGSTEKNKTPKKNLRPPTKDNLLEWILISWEQVKPSLVIESFKSCGNENDILFIDLFLFKVSL